VPAVLGESAGGEDGGGAAESVGCRGGIAVSGCFVLAGEGVVFGVLEEPVRPAIGSLGACVWSGPGWGGWWLGGIDGGFQHVGSWRINNFY
jgi:hypothetical protein